MITMDFVSRLPREKRGNDVIWVIVDRLTKSTLFLLVKMTDPVDKLAMESQYQLFQTETQDLLHVSGRAYNVLWEKI